MSGKGRHAWNGAGVRHLLSWLLILGAQAHALSTVYLFSGDEFDGEVTSLSPTHLQLVQPGAKRKTIAYAGIAAIRMGGKLVSAPIDLEVLEQEFPGIGVHQDLESAPDKADTLTAQQWQASGDLYTSAKLMQVFGHAGFIGGSILVIIGSNTRSLPEGPVLILLGAFANNVGLPLLGFGVDKAGRANQVVHPDHFPGDAGWVAYKASLGLALLANVAILGGLISIDEGDSNDAGAFLFGGVVAGIASAVCYYTSYFQFIGRSAKEAELRKKSPKATLRTIPALNLASSGEVSAGIRWVMEF